MLLQTATHRLQHVHGVLLLALSALRIQPGFRLLVPIPHVLVHLLRLLDDLCRDVRRILPLLLHVLVVRLQMVLQRIARLERLSLAERTDVDDVLVDVFVSR